MAFSEIEKISVGVYLKINKASVTAVNKELKAITARLSKTATVKLTTKLNHVGMHKEVRTLAKALSDSTTVKLKVNLDRTGIRRTESGIKDATRRMSEKAKVKVSTDVDRSSMSRTLKNMGRDISGAMKLFDFSGVSGAFSGFLRAPMLAVRAFISTAVAMSPALVALASSASFASAALVAIGPAAIGAAAGLGALIGSFMNVAEALKIAGQLDDQMTTSNSKNTLTKLRNSAAIENATEAVANAERNLVSAQGRAREAQQAINRERLAAKRDLEDLRELVSDLAADEEGASIALERARERQMQVNADAKSTYLDRREAAYDVQRAEDALSDVQREQRRRTQELTKANRLGVEGSERVVAAKKNHKDAISDIADAQRALASTQKDLTRTFLEQAEAAETVNPAAAKLNAVLAKMSPAGRKLFYVLRGLKSQSEEWRRQIEARTLPGFLSFLKAVTDRGRSGVSTMDLLVRKTALLGSSISTTVKNLGVYAKSPAFRSDFVVIMNNNKRAMDALGRAVNVLTPVLMRLFAASSPLAVRFSRYIEKISKKFANWINSFSDEELVSFFKRAGNELAKWWGIAVNIGRTLVGIMRAAFPSGSEFATTLQSLTDKLADFVNSEEGQNKLKKFFNWFKNFITDFDYEKFAKIVAGFAALKAAFSVTTGIGGMVSGLAAFSAFLNPVGAVVGIILLAAGAVAALTAAGMAASPEFKEGLLKTMQDAKNVFKNDIMPALKELWGAVVGFGRALRDMGITWELLGTIIRSAVMSALRFLLFVIKGLTFAFKFWAAGLRFWKRVFDGVVAGWKFGASVMGKVWDALSGAIAKGWNFIRDKVFNPVKTFITKTIPEAFDKGVSLIKTAWDKIEAIAKKPISFIINTVLNKGLIGAWNKLAPFFGGKAVEPVKIQGFNSGGPVPGYGTTDSVPAMLTPGEGVLTKDEMRKLGGERGFNDLRNQIRYYNKGGVVSGVPFANLFNSIGAKRGISPALLSAIARAESGYNPRAVSPAGAQGLMQFMPGTARGMGVNPFSPASAIDGAARYMKSLLKRFGGNLGMALTGYNMGPFAVSGINSYARKIMGWVGSKAGSIPSMVPSTADLIGKMTNPLLSKIPGSGFLKDIGIGMVKKLVKAASSKVSSLMNFGGAEGISGGVIGSGGGGKLGGYQSMFRWLKQMMGGKVSMSSGFRPGDPGYHGSGRAADLIFPDGSERRGGGLALKAFNLIKSNFMKNIKELIWDFAGSKAVWNGRNHFFTGGGAGPGTHNDHIHWAMDNGGPFQDGATITNYSGRPEMVLTNPQASALEERLRGGEPINVSVYVGDKEIKDIVKVEVDRNNSATAGILNRGRRR